MTIIWGRSSLVAGGIDTLEKAMGFLSAGADRIGTSAAVKIIEELRAKSTRTNS